MSEPLLLLPGIGCDAEVWRGMPAGSVMQSAADTIVAMAEDILARAPERFALAGHSLGGYVALAMIARAPERVTRLALLSTSAAADTDEQRARRLTTIAAAEADFPAVATTLGRAMLAPGRPADDPLAAETTAMILRCGLAAFVRQQGAARSRPDQTSTLAAIRVPTLVLAGAADGVIPPQRSDELHAAISGSTRVSLPGCGHTPQQEAPAETRAALEAWLGA